MPRSTATVRHLEPRGPAGGRGRTGRFARLLLLWATLSVAGAAVPEHGMAGTSRIPVLMYHRITCPPTDAALPQLWVCPSRFRAHMRTLAEAGWRTLTAREAFARVKAGRPIPSKTLVITIDDGMRDGYDQARPILRAHGFVATYAVVVGRVGGRGSMTWAELQTLTAEGHEVASHTMDHDDLRQETTAGLRYEVVRSARELRAALGIPTATFVYPFGLYDRAAVEAVRDAGYRVAFTTRWGCTASWADRLLEERVRVNGSDGPGDLLAKLRYC